MTAEGSYPSYRAPQQDGEIMCLPPWQTLTKQITTARNTLADADFQISGIPLPELAKAARRELIAQALAHTNRYTDAKAPTVSDAPLVITGHQPELVHPGVWLKNFAASQLAHQTGGIAISLIIDNDLCRNSSIRVPTGSVDKPQMVELLYDQPQEKMPYEQRTIVDRKLWNSFGQRVTKTLSSLVPDPLITDWWPNVAELSSDTPQLGLAIAQARHQLELKWSHPSLEIPQSQVCQTNAFRQFMIHLLTNAQQIRLAYNSALADYRQAHRLRSPAQPLPDLFENDGWTETPFWIWTNSTPTRRALFVRQTATALQLTDQQHWQTSLPINSPQNAIQQLADWESQGIKLRTRALITTIYARLFLADTFIHGIGGAKYDQVTDTLCKSFFGISPPEFTTLSGTLRLPIEHPNVTSSHLRKLQQTLREFRYHPESHLKDLQSDPNVAALIKKKQHGIHTPKTKNNAAARHTEITAANASLQSWLEPQKNSLESQLQAAASRSRANLVLESREYAFCLFPRDLLHKFFLDFSSQIP